jgi:conjugal transfer pilin signal peptidase TrbI
VGGQLALSAREPVPQTFDRLARLRLVTATGRAFFVDGEPVGRAKEHATTGEPLDIGPVGIIPDGRYYVAGSHPDSLDSRYRLTGWVARQQIVGKAHRVF